MKLSDAIRLGSLLVDKPQALVLDACAIGMAMKANGVSVTLDDASLMNFWQTKYPWIVDLKNRCPICGFIMDCAGNVYHPFDCHVMWDGKMTIEQLADWIATIEPNEPDQQQAEVHGLGTRTEQTNSVEA